MTAIGSDFVQETVKQNVRCSECHRWICAGAKSLVSVKNGKVAKRVCGENCRLELDARFWEEAARRNANKRRSQR